MAPVIHPLMPFARRGRLSALAVVALVGGLVGWTFIPDALDLPKWLHLAILTSFLLPLLGREALPLLKTGLAAGDGLAIDAAGLTVLREGRSVRWRWDEVSDFSLRGRLHPASLILGRFISFRVPRDDRRSAAGRRLDRLFLRGPVVAIAGDYPTQTQELFRQIEHFRNAGQAAGARSASVRAPEVLWSFRKDRKRPKIKRLLAAILIPLAGGAVGMTLISGLPESLGDLLSSPLIIGMLIGIGSVLPWVVLVQYKWEAKQFNMLALSAGGLATADKMDRRLWLWPEISDLRIQQSVSRGTDGSAATILSFRATHDGRKPCRKPKAGESPTPVSCSIEDVYETPVNVIARQARSWWEWSGETFGHDVTAGDARRPNTAGLQQIAFRRQSNTNGNRTTPLDLILSFAFIVPMLVYLAAILWMFDAGIRLGVPRWVDKGGFFLITMGPIIGYLFLLTPGVNRLELTVEGLVHVRYGFKRRWAWHEVGSAALRRVRSKWSAKQRSVLNLEMPSRGWAFGFLRWAYNIDNGRQAMFEDIYDTSLDEIAEALNEFRRRKQVAQVTRQSAG